ncbi:hypothetical protein KEJ39_02425 [Candidatus Bathyarchaeota archaeon]|nr:hypothetical protein [Candidatus Bathyarchaeota archaeon]
MPRTRRTGLGGGLATRYGTAPRRQHIEVIARMRRRHECPQCQRTAARRLSVGLWECRRCGFQFAGGAYTPSTKTGDVARRSATGLTHSTSPEESLPIKTASAGPKPEPKKRRRKAKADDTIKEESQ